MSRLFISHSSANNAEAVAIRDWLAGEGWNDVLPRSRSRARHRGG